MTKRKIQNEDPTPQLTKLEIYAKSNTDVYPKLPSALKELRQFVGATDIKETVAKSLQYVISHQMRDRPIRKSTRKRKEPGRLILGKTTCRQVKRPRRDTEDSDVWVDDDDSSSEEDEDEMPMDEAMRSLSGLIAVALRQHGMKEDESSDEEEEDEKKLRYKKPEYLKGLFQHTMLLGSPGTGKTTFAGILVELWDALGIIDKKRYFVTSRGDWVGKYQGHSVDKAKKLITKARGGVLFIDEAYSLIAARDGDDTYGHEVLTEIVESMSNPDKNVTFIFAGYADDMNRLFTANKGLSRRFGYILKLTKPSVLHLFLIFQKQLMETKWKVAKSERESVLGFFQQHNKIFEWGGGSTTTFIQHAKQSAISRSFPNAHERKITLADLEDARKTLLQHNKTADSIPPGIKHMYM